MASPSSCPSVAWASRSGKCRLVRSCSSAAQIRTPELAGRSHAERALNRAQRRITPILPRGPLDWHQRRKSSALRHMRSGASCRAIHRIGQASVRWTYIDVPNGTVTDRAHPEPTALPSRRARRLDDPRRTSYPSAATPNTC